MKTDIKILDSLPNLLVNDTDGDNYIADCVFCDKENHLSISREEGHVFQCWSCQATGNIWTLLDGCFVSLPEITTPAARELRDLKPGTKASTFARLKLRYQNGTWYWPVYREDGNLASIYHYSEQQGAWYSTPKPCSFTLLGAEYLTPNGKIYLAEGHWDYASLFPHFINSEHSLLGVCGSNYPAKHLRLLVDREIIYLSDNDEAGEKSAHSLASTMKKKSMRPASLQKFDWSQVKGIELSPGFDMRDLLGILK